MSFAIPSLQRTVVSLPRAWLRADYGVIAAIVAVVVAMNSWWLVAYRSGGLMDIDEAGYLATSLEYSIRAKSQGWIGLWITYQGHAPSAPLVPFVASLVYDVFGTHYMLAFGVLVLAMAAVAICSAALAFRMGGPIPAVVATVAVVGTPGLIDFTRSFQFALPVAACVTGAILCMSAWQRLGNTRLALVWGVLLGLMLLSRTMTVAFLPGFVVAGLLVAATSPERWRALANLALGLLAGALVAATWYAANWQAVSDYLFNFGYGTQSLAYGGGVPLSPSVVIDWIRRQVNEYVYLPLALVLLVGWVAGVALLIAEFRRRRGRLPLRLQWLLSRGRVVTAIPLLAGLAALMSSENQGVGFIVPLLPGAIVLAVVSLAKLPWPRARVAALALVVMAGVCGVAGKSGLGPFDRATLAITLPVYGDASVIDPAGQIQLYQLDGGYGDSTLSPSADWQAAERQAAQNVTDLAQQTGRPPVCAFGFEDRFFSPNQLWLESSAISSAPIPSVWLDASSGSSADGVAQWLDAGGAKSANVLITAGNMGLGEIPPSIDQTSVEEVAAATGFRPARHLALPNGTRLTFWVRAAAPVAS